MIISSSPFRSRDAFTLIELLLVIGVIVALAVTVFVALNPAQRLAQARDANRLNDVASMQSALNMYQIDAAFAGQVPSLGATNTIYISVPDPIATTTAGTNCSGLGFPAGYHCPASSTYRNPDGTGWIPVNLASIPGKLTLSKLPVDPVNTSSSAEYYAYMTDGTNWEIAAQPEALQNQSSTGSFAAGTTKSLITLGWGTGGGGGGSATTTYTTTLSGVSGATGTAEVDINPTTHTMRVQATFFGLAGTVTSAALNGPTAVPLTGTAGMMTMSPKLLGFPVGVTSGTYDNTFDTSTSTTYYSTFLTNNGGTAAGAEAAFFAAFAAKEAYFTIRTTAYAGGEIQGFPVH